MEGESIGLKSGLTSALVPTISDVKKSDTWIKLEKFLLGY